MPLLIRVLLMKVKANYILLFRVGFHERFEGEEGKEMDAVRSPNLFARHQPVVVACEHSKKECDT